MANEQSFLGRGWHFPPQFIKSADRYGQAVMVADEDDIEQSLAILLSTSLGERIMYPDFGCDMQGYLFAEIDAELISNLKDIVTDAILKYEPRIDLEEIEVNNDSTQPGLLLINISYNIRNTNSRRNLVYPFYINEATDITV